MTGQAYTMGDREFRDQEKKLKRTPQKIFDRNSSKINEKSSQHSDSGDFNRGHSTAKMDDQYNHPVYNTISYINGQINRMDIYNVNFIKIG